MKFLFVVVLFLVIPGCALFSKDNKEKLPENLILNNFPLVSQSDAISCGPASCSMLLKFYGKNISLEEAKKVAKTKWFNYKGEDIGMTLPPAVSNTLTYFGVKSSVKTGTTEDIKRLIKENRPPIVLMRSRDIGWHYVIVIGYNSKEMIVANPSGGVIHNIPIEIFKKGWDFSGDMYEGNIFPEPDLMRKLLWLADVTGNMMIVPSPR